MSRLYLLCTSFRNGEKAANYVIQKYPSLFKHDWEADNTETWLKMFDEKTEVCVQHLEEVADAETDSQPEKHLEDSVESLQKLIFMEKV